jgi:hypothetical protein
MNAIEINRGSTFRTALTWPDGSGGAANLTGCTVSVIDASITVEATISNAAAGTITLHISDETTAALMPGNLYSFRLRIGLPNGDAATTDAIRVDIQ